MKDLRLAEIAREGDVLGVADVLLGEHQHEMAHPDVVQLAERLGVERLAHVDPAHVGAQRGMQGADLSLAGC